MSGVVPDADVVVEALRIVEGATARGVSARVLGGVGVALHDHGPVPDSLRRTYGDIDIVVPAKSTKATSAALISLGYEPNERFNALHGARRMLFYDNANSRQLDVFVGVFAMCHELDLNRRLDEHAGALDAADLLLTKLQIAEINRKDVVDGVRLVLTHELGEPPPSGTDRLSVQRLQSITASDWGWFTTLTDNLARLREASEELLDGDDAGIVHIRIDTIRAALDGAPKSIRWRTRSIVGRKAPWYELPEEVNRGATP